MSANDHVQPAADPEASSSHVEITDTSMPDAAAPVADVTPAEIIPRIASTGSQPRVYLNSKVTPHLMEAMKNISLNQPEKPLKWLSEFLAARSREVEGE